jgi:hypothetical protein
MAVFTAWGHRSAARLMPTLLDSVLVFEQTNPDTADKDGTHTQN